MARREAILAAALESVDATGATAIEEIRRRSGASVGSIYHHFGGIDGIDAALYVEVLRDYQEGALGALHRARSAEEGVKALVRHHLRWVELKPERARFLLRGGTARAGAGEELKELNRALATELEDWVARQPAIGSLPLEVFYASVIGPAQELTRAWLAGRVASPRRVEDELAEATWRAIRAD